MGLLRESRAYLYNPYMVSLTLKGVLTYPLLLHNIIHKVSAAIPV